MACGCSGPCGHGTMKDGFTVPDAATLKCSLAQKLIPAVDRIRDIYTRVGARPYRVFIVRTRFAGPTQGVGVEQVVSEMEILPTPLVVDMRALSEVITPVGMDEQGVVQLQYISGRYTEETLLGIGSTGAPLAANETSYYEIIFFRPDGGAPARRRFVRDSVPMYNALQFQWQVSLVAALEKRTRDGVPRG